MIAPLLSAVFFGCSAWLASYVSGILCAEIPALEGAPPSAEPPVHWMIAGSAIVGGLLAMRGVPAIELLLAAVVCVALVGAWYCDSRRGVVPDAFTLPPLLAIAVIALAFRTWPVVIGGLALFLPFAAAAFFSKGRGMGWGDVKLAALGGMALGAPVALMAAGVACITAALVCRARGIKTGPIAFAPYLAAFIGIAIPVGGFL